MAGQSAIRNPHPQSAFGRGLRRPSSGALLALAFAPWDITPSSGSHSRR
jgi:hypothetical protein